MSCPFKVNSSTIELTVHTSSYCILDLLCVKILGNSTVFRSRNIISSALIVIIGLIT